MTKLQPLGIPAAIRRIAAASINFKYKHDFAVYLLPYNYAIGAGGGLDFITTTLRLGLDKYMLQCGNATLLPSRALVSLDIQNMFNAISRQKVWEIVYDLYPELQDLIDCLYEDDGTTCLKLDNWTWTEIPVSKGFSQGCPLSPVLSTIVLNYILAEVILYYKRDQN